MKRVVFSMFVNKHASTPRCLRPPDDFIVKYDEEASADSGFFNCVSHTNIEYSDNFLRKTRGMPKTYKGLIVVITIVHCLTVCIVSLTDCIIYSKMTTTLNFFEFGFKNLKEQTI